MNTRFDHDLGLRHKPGITSDDFIRLYCPVLRPYAFATPDDSLNEFEKLLAHVVNMLCYHRRLCELLNMPEDPRDGVEAIESAEAAMRAAEAQLRRAMQLARGVEQ